MQSQNITAFQPLRVDLTLNFVNYHHPSAKRAPHPIIDIFGFLIKSDNKHSMQNTLLSNTYLFPLHLQTVKYDTVSHASCCRFFLSLTRGKHCATCTQSTAYLDRQPHHIFMLVRRLIFALEVSTRVPMFRF